MKEIKRIDDLIPAAQKRSRVTVAVAAAGDDAIMQTVHEAARLNIAEFFLFGNPDLIKKYGKESGATWLQDKHIIATTNDAEAARLAVEAVRSGKAGAIMKGQLPTATFLRAILDKENGLRSGRQLSIGGIYDKADGSGVFMITDPAMNVKPDIMEKKAILENGVDLLHRIGMKQPRVAVLCALETVNLDMQDTIDAAILSKMADRGQIKGCLVDGPLALDIAVSEEGARHKGVTGPVAGHADLLLTPDIEAGNMLHKSLHYFAHIECASLVLGASAPVIATSRSDTVRTKLLSVALGVVTA